MTVPTPPAEGRSAGFGLIDAAGVAALTALTVGAWLLWGAGWALIVFGVLVGAVYVYLEVVIPSRRTAGRRRDGRA